VPNVANVPVQSIPARIVISTNVTLDGVVQDPDGQEGFRRGGWFSEFGGKDVEAWAEVAFEEALSADALLLGRRSDEWFAARWASRPGAWADRLNSLPKYVVSSTLDRACWTNSTVLKGDVGVGERLFGETVDQKPMRLLESGTIGDRLAVLTYEPVGVAGSLPAAPEVRTRDGFQRPVGSQT
jgi:hypothetical protein